MDDYDDLPLAAGPAEYLHERAVALLSTLTEWNSLRKNPTGDGLSHVITAVRGEERWISSLLRDGSVNPGRLTSNIPFFEALLGVAWLERPITAIYKTFRYRIEEGDVLAGTGLLEKACVRVDVVASDGRRWIKAISKSTRALRQELTSCPYGIESLNQSFVDSLLLHTNARSLLAAARQNPVHYGSPDVVFKFVNARRGEDPYVDAVFFVELAKMGIFVETADDIPNDVYDGTQVYEESLLGDQQQEHRLRHTQPPPLSSCLNLDVTALMALCSSISHSPVPISPEVFLAEALRTQAASEQKRRIFCMLIPILLNRPLHATETAYRRLADIVNIVGGECEKRRAQALFSDEGMPLPDFVYREPSLADYLITPTALRVQVVPDIISDEFLSLLDPAEREKMSLTHNIWNAATPPSSHGKKSKFAPRLNMPNVIIYGTGAVRGETTLTANGKIARSLAGDEGITGVGIHVIEPRSLAEAKVPDGEKLRTMQCI